MIQRSIVLMFILAAVHVSLVAQAPSSVPGVRDVLMQFTATDGTPLEAKLSLPRMDSRSRRSWRSVRAGKERSVQRTNPPTNACPEHQVIPNNHGPG